VCQRRMSALEFQNSSYSYVSYVGVLPNGWSLLAILFCVSVFVQIVSVVGSYCGSGMDFRTTFSF